MRTVVKQAFAFDASCAIELLAQLNNWDSTLIARYLEMEWNNLRSRLPEGISVFEHVARECLAHDASALLRLALPIKLFNDERNSGCLRMHPYEETDLRSEDAKRKGFFCRRSYVALTRDLYTINESNVDKQWETFERLREPAKMLVQHYLRETPTNPLRWKSYLEFCPSAGYDVSDFLEGPKIFEEICKKEGGDSPQKRYDEMVAAHQSPVTPLGAGYVKWCMTNANEEKTADFLERERKPYELVDAYSADLRREIEATEFTIHNVISEARQEKFTQWCADPANEGKEPPETVIAKIVCLYGKNEIYTRIFFKVCEEKKMGITTVIVVHPSRAALMTANGVNHTTHVTEVHRLFGGYLQKKVNKGKTPTLLDGSLTHDAAGNFHKIMQDEKTGMAFLDEGYRVADANHEARKEARMAEKRVKKLAAKEEQEEATEAAPAAEVNEEDAPIPFAMSTDVLRSRGGTGSRF